MGPPRHSETDFDSGLLPEFGLNTRKDLILAGPAPEPVDRETIARYIDQKLADPVAGYIASLIGQYQEWFNAYHEELRRRETGGSN